MTKKAIVTLKFKDKIYNIVLDFENASDTGIRFMFEDGNYACDCNLSIFIQEQVDENFELMECGEEIKLLNLQIKEVEDDQRNIEKVL